jgi:hypothetical protein
MAKYSLGSEDVKILRDMRAALADLQKLLANSRGLNIGTGLSVPQQPRQRDRLDIGGDNGRWFKITSSTQDGSNYRWVYSMTEVYKSGVGYNAWTDVPSGITTTKGYNGIEDQNGSSGTYGSNIAQTNLSGTFAMKPIYTGARVRAWPLANTSNDVEWWFVATTLADGAC